MAPAYGTYTRYQLGADDWTKGEQVMYDTFSRSTWALGVSWFIIVASTGYPGYLGDWMNHTMYHSLGRMVYPAFLFHSLTVFGQVYSQQVVIFVSWTKMVSIRLSEYQA